MILEEFTALLETHNIPFSTTDKSIIFGEAPCCGGRYKIYLFKESKPYKPLFGKCMKCDTNWSSVTYLTEMGIPKPEIDLVHGDLGMDGFDLHALPEINLMAAEKTKSIQLEPEHKTNLTPFYKVTEQPNHPASKYAKKRGWTEAQDNDILIDIYSNSVVFVCKDETGEKGFQRRFLKPVHKDTKTKTETGFVKAKHVIQYPNTGDIVIAEGPFTALAAWHYGYHGICTFGATVSQKQLELILAIAKASNKRVGIGFDIDSAGRKGYGIIRRFMADFGVKTFKVAPEVGNDLNDSWMAGKGILVKEDLTDISIPTLDLEDMRDER